MTERYVDTIPVQPAEAATDIGADYGNALPEGGGISLLWAFVLVTLIATGAVLL